jgi:hypothetical protein
MSNHERFEELGAMAAAGEISAEERRELLAHLERCASCEKIFADMKEIHATWLPERNGFEIKRSFAAESNLRQSILERVGAEGAQFSSEALLPVPPVSHPPALRHQKLFYCMLAAAAVALLALADAGILHWINSRRLSSQPSATANSARGAISSSPIPSPAAARPEIPDDDARQAERAQRILDTALKDAEAERLRLEQKLSEAERRADTAQESNTAVLQEISHLRAQLEVARGNESKAESQLASLKTSNSDREVELNLAQAENADLREKLSKQTAGVDRERELMADGREIRDLIAARNLHIIDVYDTSGEGKTQKSFGRVFYTEGKSLVFYAYDLPSRRPPTKYAYYAWGKRDSSGEVKVRNLGIFYNDDQAQRRWVLTITDPQALLEIDSVFVTLEKTDDSGNTPRGKKLLSAYLGSPANHP